MSENVPPKFEELQRVMATELARHWKLFLLQGLIISLLGVAAIVLPQVATLAIDILVGWILILGGIIRGITLFRSRSLPGTILSLLRAILAIVLGVLLIAKPAEGVLTLTMVLVALFIFQGIFSILIALQVRKHVRSWGWTMVSGIVDLFLAYFIMRGWPDTASWAIGLLVGINLLFVGMALISNAIAAKPDTDS